MNSSEDHLTPLAAKILEAEAKLQQLEEEIEEIGHPANDDLRRRLEALKIEEKALKRNFVESSARGEPDSVRIEKIETLLRHIEREEDSVKHEADFLQRANPSSMTMAVEGSVKAMEFLRDGVKKVIGDHHPLGSSAFVNHTHENLREEYGVEDRPGEPK